MHKRTTFSLCPLLRVESIRLLYLLVFSCFMVSTGQAQVHVTAGTGGEDFCAEPGIGIGYITLGNITIAESSTTDFVDDIGIRQLVIEPSDPSVEFQAGSGVLYISGAGISLTSFTVTASRVTIEYLISVGSDLSLNAFTISYLRLKSNTGVVGAQLQRAAVTSPAFNNANLNGLNPGSPTSLADLNSYDKPISSLVVSPASANVCLNSTLGVTVVGSQSGFRYQLKDQSDNPLSPVLLGNGGNLAITSSAIGASVTSIKVDAFNASSSACSSTLDDIVAVTVITPPSILTNPTGITVCENSAASFSVSATGVGVGANDYQWQVSTDGGTNYTDVMEVSPYSGTKTSTLSLSNIPISLDGSYYRVTVSGDCGPVAVSGTAMLTVQGLPLISSGPDDIKVCNGGGTSFSVTAFGASLDYQWQVDDGKGGGFKDISDGGIYSGTKSTTLDLGGVTSNEDNHAYRAVVSVPCGASSTSVTAVLDVIPKPIASLSGTTAVCDGESAELMVTAVGEGPFDIRYSDGSTMTDVSGISDGHRINVTPSTSTTYQLLDISNTDAPSCTGTAIGSAVVTVHSLPTGTLTGGTTVCEGESAVLTFHLSGTGPFDVTYGDGANTFYLNGISDGHTITVSPSSTETYSLLSIRDSQSPNCNSSPMSSTTVTVYPLPTGTLTGDATICEGGSTVLTFHLSGTGPFDVTYDDGVSTLSLNDISDGHTMAVSPSSSTTYSLLSISDGHSPSCVTSSPVGGSVIITVDEMPVANAGTDMSICGLSFLADAQPSTGVGVWALVSGPGTATYNNPNSPNATITVDNYGKYVFSWTETNGVCSDSDQITLDFHEVPHPNAGTDGAVCGLTYGLNATPSVGSGQWVLVSGSGTAVFGDNMMAVTTVTVSDYGAYTFRWEEDNNGCTGSSGLTVYFSQAPNIISLAHDGEVLCSPKEVQLEGRIGGGASSAIWTVVSAASGAMGASSVTGDLVTATYTPDPGEFGPLVFRMKTDDPDGAGPCHADSAEVTITLSEAPKIISVAGDGDSFCEPGTIDLSGVIGGSATTGTWVFISGGTGTLDGTVVSGSTVTDRYQVVSGEYGPLVFELVTDDPDMAGPCDQARQRVTLHVQQGATVSVPADFTLCEPTSIPLQGNIGGSASSGSWQKVTGAGVMGTSSLSGDEVTAIYTLDPADIGQVLTFKLVTDDPDGSGPCTAVADSFDITINPSAKVSAGSDISICEDVNDVMLNGTVGGAASVYSWSGGTGSFDNASDPVATYTYSTDEIGTDITLTLTVDDPDGAGPCTSVSDDVVLTVDTLPNVIFFNLPPTVAENDPMLVLEGNHEGGGFSISPGVGLGSTYIVPGEGDKVKFMPPDAVIGSNLITYAYTDPRTNCSNTDTQEVFVNELTSIDFSVEGATLDFSGNPQICSDIGNVGLLGAPAASTGSSGTAFSSSDVLIQRDAADNYFFNTDGLASGTYRILYTYVNAGGAVSTIPKNVRVFSSPVADIDIVNSCIDAEIQFNDSSTVPKPAFSSVITQWEWDFGDGSPVRHDQNPTHIYASPEKYTVDLSVVTDKGCKGSVKKEIKVGAVPKVKFSWAVACSGDATEFVDASDAGTSNIIGYAWDFGDGDTLSSGVGGIAPGTHTGRTSGTYKEPLHQYEKVDNYDVTLTAVTDDGCISSFTQQIFTLQMNVISPSSAIYLENFESGTGGWVAKPKPGSNMSWVYGVADGANIKSPDNKVWWTGGNAKSYFPAEDSYVYGPCFDLTALRRPMISFDYWSDGQKGFDGAVLQYSTNGGLKWTNIGIIGEGQNWYNEQAVISNPGDQPVGQYAWSGSSGGWLNGSFKLDSIPPSERGFVRLRVAFGSDENNPSGVALEGFAFDNVKVQGRRRNVFIEHFTNTAPGIGHAADDYLYGLFPEGEANPDAVFLQYHLDIPENDLFYPDNPTDVRARALYYGVSEAPRTIMGGKGFSGLTFDLEQKSIEKRALEEPPFSLDAEVLASAEDVLSVSITLTPKENFEKAVILQAAVMEKKVLGADGRTYRNVAKKLLFGGAGKKLDAPWQIGTPQKIRVDWDIDVRLYDPTTLAMIVFLQDRATREVYQTIFMDLPKKSRGQITGIHEDKIHEADGIVVYPNPVRGTLFFRITAPLSHDYGWEIVDQRGVSVERGKLSRFNTTYRTDLTNTIPSGVYFLLIKDGRHVLSRKKIMVLAE